MRFISKDTTWTQPMKDYMEQALIKHLKRTHLEPQNCEIKVSLIDRKSKSFKVEVSGEGFIAQNIGKDFYTTANAAALKFKNLALKQAKKAIATKRRKLELVENAYEEVDTFNVLDLISKEKVFKLIPENLERAVEAFEQTDYKFYVFQDLDYNNVISILYRRADDTIGIIRCTY